MIKVSLKSFPSDFKRWNLLSLSLKENLLNLTFDSEEGKESFFDYWGIEEDHLSDDITLNIDIEDTDYFTQEIAQKYEILDYQGDSLSHNGLLEITLFFKSEEGKKKYIKDHNIN